MPKPSAPPRASRFLRASAGLTAALTGPTPRVLGVLLVLLLALSLGRFEYVPPTPDLDPSWMQSLSFFLRQRLQFGEEVVFTYGPLGPLFARIYDPGLHPLVVGWEVLWKGFLAWELVRVCAAGAGRPLWRTADLLVFAALLNVRPLFADVDLYLTLFVAAAVAGFDPGLPVWRRLVWHLILAVLTLGKVTLLPLCLPVALCLGLAAAGGPRRRAGVLFANAAVFLGLCATAWVLCGQRLDNVPRFLISSFEIAQGYNGAMYLPGLNASATVSENSPGKRLVLTGLVLLLVGLVTAGFAARAAAAVRRGARAEVLFVVASGVIWFLAFKHGLVRCDGTHRSIFFAFTWCLALLLLLLPARHPSAASAERNGRWDVGKVALLGAFVLGFGLAVYDGKQQPGPRRIDQTRVARSFAAIALPGRMAREAEEVVRIARRQSLASPDRPEEAAFLHRRVPQLAGREPIDAFSFEQHALLTLGLAYRPRPVFQGYSAYTESLQEKNAAFYVGRAACAAAPPRVLFRMQPIDEKYPTLDDARALLVLLYGYRVEEGAGDWLLLRPSAGGGERAVLDAVVGLRSEPGTVVPLGEWTPIPRPEDGGTIWASFRVGEKPLIARAASTLWKPSGVRIEVRLSGGEVRSFRMPAPMAEAGFVLSPFLDTTARVRAWMEGGRPGVARPPAVEAFGLVPEEQGLSVLSGTARWRWTALPALARSVVAEGPRGPAAESAVP